MKRDGNPRHVLAQDAIMWVALVRSSIAAREVLGRTDIPIVLLGNSSTNKSRRVEEGKIL
jgi:hypothetical protein